LADVEVAMPEPTWQGFYRAALLELDPKKINEQQRLDAEDETIAPEEHERLDAALRFLYLLTRGSGSA
jgi:hypothetical protein